jgi:hypothetical protein
MRRLLIEATPPLVFDAALLRDVGAQNAGLNGETPNMSVTLDNTHGHLTTLFAVPPLRARAFFEIDGALFFEGRIQSVTLGAHITLILEA